MELNVFSSVFRVTEKLIVGLARGLAMPDGMGCQLSQNANLRHLNMDNIQISIIFTKHLRHLLNIDDFYYILTAY